MIHIQSLLSAAAAVAAVVDVGGGVVVAAVVVVEGCCCCCDDEVGCRPLDHDDHRQSYYLRTSRSAVVVLLGVLQGGLLVGEVRG